MRRKTDKDIGRENIFLIVFSLIMVFIGFFLPWLHYNAPTVEYDQLSSKEVTIQSLKWIYQYRGGYYRIISTSGERFHVSGDYDKSQLKTCLVSDTTVQIKYHTGNFCFFSINYAEEITQNGELIVSYNNDEDSDLRVLYLVSGFFILVGIGGLLFVGWLVKHNRIQQAKRDQRIIRKYGSEK